MSTPYSQIACEEQAGSKCAWHRKVISILVFTRKLNEKLIIGSSIVITVVRIDGLQVRIGIEAPSEVTVLREEIAPPQKAGQYHHQLDRPTRRTSTRWRLPSSLSFRTTVTPTLSSTSSGSLTVVPGRHRAVRW